MNKKIIKGLKIALNVVFYFIIAFLLIFSIMNINAKSNTDFPNIFGRGFLAVQSDSMTKVDGLEISFEKGDLIYAKKLSSKEKMNLEVGQVIVYYDENLRSLNTHRIVYVLGDEDNKVYFTQGNKAYSYRPFDSEKLENNYGFNDYETVQIEMIRGLYTGKSTGTGATIQWLTNPKGGFIFCIILPTFLFLILEIFMVIKNIMALKQSKLELAAKEDKELLKAQLEEEKEALRKEILEQLRKEVETQKIKDEEEKDKSE